MFETSVIRVSAAAAPRRVGLLSASIAFHSLIVIAAVAVTVTSVELPQKAPHEMELFRPIPVVSLPPALGTPHPAARPAAPVPSTPRPTPPVMVTAPSTVPDVVEPVAPVATIDPAATGPAGGTASAGRPDGVPGGVGDSDAAVGPPSDAIMVPGGEVRSATVLHRVDPIFPRAAMAGRMNGTVVVRCIIGKDGTCREPEILSSTFAIFNQPAIDAVEQWRFAPGSYRGQIVETYFELTVRFNIK